MTHYVYKITNTIENIDYIGKSIDPKARWYHHCCDAKNGSHLTFHCAIRNSGVEAFELSVIEEHLDAKSAYKAEHRIIKAFRAEGRPLYNENNGGLGGPDPTPELRARISASVKNALKNADMSFYSNPEYRAKLSKSVSESYTDELREKRANSTVEQWARWREQKALVEPDRAYIIYKEAGDRARRKGDHEHASELYQHAERYRKAS